MRAEEIDKKPFDLIARLLPNPGLHPRLNLSISFNSLLTNHQSSQIQSTTTTRTTKCLISILFRSITPSLFFDRFQLENLSLSGNLENPIIPNQSTINLTTDSESKRPISWGSRDLEAPVSLASSSGLLIPLPFFTNAIQNSSKVLVEVEVPLHIRYLHPVLHSWDPKSLEIDLLGPSLGWSCDRSKPLDFQPILHQTPFIKLLAPIGNQSDLIYVELITTFVIWFSFLWIGFTALRSRCYLIKIKSS